MARTSASEKGTNTRNATPSRVNRTAKKTQSSRGVKMSPTIKVTSNSSKRVKNRTSKRLELTARLPMFAAMRSAISIFEIRQSQLCRISTALNDAYQLPKVAPDQLCKFLAGEREMNTQCFECLEIALQIASEPAFAHYRSLVEQDRAALITDFTCEVESA